MQVLYTYDSEAKSLKVYVEPRRNTTELDREEADSKARDIARHGGFARVVLGGSVVAEYGTDPRHF